MTRRFLSRNVLTFMSGYDSSHSRLVFICIRYYGRFIEVSNNETEFYNSAGGAVCVLNLINIKQSFII